MEMEIIVDADGPEERAMGWYYYRKPQEVGGQWSRSLYCLLLTAYFHVMLTQTSPVTTRDALAGLIPVSIVTGFLGAGKTTLVNRLLKRPEMNRVAVILNELGEIGVDNDLIEFSSEQMMLLNNGCLCCVLRG
ncbi:MAG: GTP-binding protein, partial [Terriglobales bacterium]